MMDTHDAYLTPTCEILEIQLQQIIATSMSNAPTYNGFGGESNWDSIN